MFKSCSALRIASPDTLALLRSELFESVVSKNPSLPPHKTQWRRWGFHRPAQFGELDVYVGAGNVRMFCMCQQERVLPGAVINRVLNERIADFESHTNEKPNRKEIAQMKDQVTAELLPDAYIRDSHVMVIVSKEWMLFNTSSPKVVEEIMSYLRDVVGNAEELEHLPQWRHLAVTLMPDREASNWLRTIALDPFRMPVLEEGQTLPDDTPRFRHLESIGLKDKSSGVVRFKDIDFLEPEVEAALSSGKRVIDLGVEWGPEAGETALNCVITEKLVVRGLKFSEIIIEKADNTSAEEQSAHYFDSTFAIISSLLIRMITSIYQINSKLAIDAEAAETELSEGERDSALNDDGAEPDEYGNTDDGLYPAAVELVTVKRNASISMLQRELRIGYNRAARMLETMEEKHIVSAQDITGKRTVYDEDDEV